MPKAGMRPIYGINWPAMVECEEQLDALRQVPVRPTDVYVCTWPKAGTHWVHKICTSLLDHDQFLYPMEFNPWHRTGGNRWEEKGMSKGGGGKFGCSEQPAGVENPRVKYSSGPPFFKLAHEAIPDPRIIVTHVPFSFLPEGAQKGACKLIYITRDPKDACVSFQNFSQKNPFLEPLSIERAVEMWVQGASLEDQEGNTANGAPYGGQLWHCKTYVDAAENEGVRNRIHFVNYDRLTLDKAAEIQKLALFLTGETLTEDKVAQIIQESSFDTMKAAAKKEEEAKGRGKGAIGRAIIGNPMEWSNILYNKGERGQGKAKLTPEQARAIDAAYAEGLREFGHLFLTTA